MLDLNKLKDEVHNESFFSGSINVGYIAVFDYFFKSATPYKEKFDNARKRVIDKMKSLHTDMEFSQEYHHGLCMIKIKLK